MVCHPYLPFQFHKGTIKTNPVEGCFECISYFNSIKVRLKLVMNHYLVMNHRHFNSIKVRLKQCGPIESR